MNPNNCSTCDHIKNPDGGHCYMFRTEPDERCMQHTDLKASKSRPSILSVALATALHMSEIADEDRQ